MQSKHLNQRKKKALGKNPSNEIWNSQLEKFYKPYLFYEEEEEEEGEEEDQTYDFFVDMGLRPPNNEASGRNVLSPKANKIGIIILGYYSKNSLKISSLISLLKAYFCLKVKIICFLDMKKENNVFSIIDYSKSVSFPLKTIGSKIEVFSILDVLSEYYPSNFSLIGITNKPIMEKGNPELILGRACGDGMCVISSYHSSQKEMALTVLHECLHTIGIEHCTLYSCIMNPTVSGDQSPHLCPIELRKLNHAIKFNIQKRFLKLQKIYRQLGWIQEEEWVAKRISNGKQNKKRKKKFN